MIDDRELEERLLSYVVGVQRKSMLERLAAEGRIQSFGDLSKPQFSEVRRDPT